MLTSACSASLPGLGADTPTTSTTEPPTFEELAAVGAAYELRLSTLGEAPLEPLVRPQPVGSAWTHEVDVVSATTHVRATVTVRVIASAADGSSDELELILEALTSSSLTGGRDDDDPLADELLVAVGATSTVRRDAARALVDGTRSLPADLTRRADLAAQSVFDVFEAVSLPLPLPAVGDGGTWTVQRSSGDASEVDLRAVTVRRDDGALVATAPATASAPALRLELDGVGPFGRAATATFEGIVATIERADGPSGS